MDPGRFNHYRDFYGSQHREQVAVVWGNCQAEAVRVLLAASPSFPFPAVRVPPVHELEPADLPPLRRLLPHVAVLISQPVRSGYRGLTLGTEELSSALMSRAKVLRWPVVRYVGLHPFSAIVRHPADPGLDPPVVPYHDLRTLARPAGRPPSARPGPDAYRSVAAASVSELARRERAGTDVGVSDLIASLGWRAAHTLNHPGNGLLIALVQRIQKALGVPADAAEPGRQLLGKVSAPLEEPVLAALGLDAAPDDHWVMDGHRIHPGQVQETQLSWYRANPACVSEGLRRHATRLATLGL